MAKQTFVFVVLPNGISAKKTPQASIFWVPRLDGGGTLASFPDVLNWPKLIQGQGLKFELSSGSKTATAAVDTKILRPDIWQEIFKPSTFVEPVKFPDYDKRLIVSYPTRDALSYLKYTYQTIGSGTFSGDGQRGFFSLLSDLIFRQGKESQLDAALSNARVSLWQAQQAAFDGGGSIETPQIKAAFVPSVPKDGVPTTLTAPANGRDTITRFALFHHMPPAPHRPSLPSTAADFAKTLDFHKALTALGSYPSLMRALGLVFDIELPAGFCSVSPAAGAYGAIGLKQVNAGFSWAVKPVFSFPATAYTLDSSAFRAAPATIPANVATGNFVAGDVIGGLVSLSLDNFNLSEVDLDGALLQALTFADNVANVFQNFTQRYQQLIDNAMPALRSAGISLMASGRGLRLLQSILNNKSFDSALTSSTPYPRPFNMLDLVRGYRIDIWDSLTGRWHSLHHRSASYEFGPHAQLKVNVPNEEGFLQTAAAQPADDPKRKDDPNATANEVPQPGTDIFIHERLARWDGWSLSVKRPGLALNRSVDPGKALDPDPTENQPITPFKMVSSFKPVAGTLPSLRFGRGYRLRARAVDLAGNSIPETAASDGISVLPAGGGLFPYARFEPVGPPLVVLRSNPDAGGALLRMVIRSYNSSLNLDSVASGASDTRHIAPPRTSERLAERHGMFDDAHGKLKGDAATYHVIATRDGFEIPAQSAGGPPLVAADKFNVGYLPDPFARGAALRDLPNAPDDTNGAIGKGKLNYTVLPDVQTRPGSVTFVDFGTQWPERLAFRLVLVEGAGAPVWDATARVLTVALPKGAAVESSLSCYMTPKDLESMGVWGWLRELFEALEIQAVQGGSAETELVFTSDLVALITRLVVEGGHEMLTPALALNLVHAVQQPLGEPVFVQLPVIHQPKDPIYASALRNSFTPITAWRTVGSHDAVLLGGLSVNGQSSASIELLAQMLEVTDDPSKSAPAFSWTGAHVETIPLATTAAGPVATDPVSNRLVGVYIPQTDQFWFSAPFDVLEGVSTPASVAAPIHRFDDSKHRWVSYAAKATSRYQEYFSNQKLDFTRLGPALLVDVPSSARPLAPEIAYVVPTFGWENQETTNVKSSVRFGNGLRVYLKRPWYSSGDNEQLGVLLWNGVTANPDYATREKFKPYFTQWGDDPIWQSSGLDAVPGTQDFPGAAATAQALTIEETSLIAFDVAAHDVQFDLERGLWCCDIELNNSNSYAPFIRLALARYQSHAITGVELSRVVLADFAQLAPNRSAVVSIDPNQPQNARLFVGGLAPAGPTANTIVVAIERRLPDVRSDLGWENAPASVVSVHSDPVPADQHAVLWSGSIVFAKKPASGQFRVVIKEFENLRVDPPQFTPLKDPTPNETVIFQNFGTRLVYAAILPYNY